MKTIERGKQMEDKNVTHVTLREFIERIMDEREKHLQTRFNNLNSNLEIATKELDKKLLELNNLRKEYSEDRTSDQKQYLKQDVYYTKIETIDKWTNDADKKITAIETRHTTWVAAMGLFIIAIEILFKYVL